MDSTAAGVAGRTSCSCAGAALPRFLPPAVGRLRARPPVRREGRLCWDCDRPGPRKRRLASDWSSPPLAGSSSVPSTPVRTWRRFLPNGLPPRRRGAAGVCTICAWPRAAASRATWPRTSRHCAASSRPLTTRSAPSSRRRAWAGSAPPLLATVSSSEATATTGTRPKSRCVGCTCVSRTIDAPEVRSPRTAPEGPAADDSSVSRWWRADVDRAEAGAGPAAAACWRAAAAPVSPGRGGDTPAALVSIMRRTSAAATAPDAASVSDMRRSAAVRSGVEERPTMAGLGAACSAAPAAASAAGCGEGGGEDTKTSRVLIASPSGSSVRRRRASSRSRRAPLAPEPSAPWKSGWDASWVARRAEDDLPVRGPAAAASEAAARPRASVRAVRWSRSDADPNRRRDLLWASAGSSADRSRRVAAVAMTQSKCSSPRAKTRGTSSSRNTDSTTTSMPGSPAACAMASSAGVRGALDGAAGPARDRSGLAGVGPTAASMGRRREAAATAELAPIPVLTSAAARLRSRAQTAVWTRGSGSTSSTRTTRRRLARFAASNRLLAMAGAAAATPAAAASQAPATACFTMAAPGPKARSARAMRMIASRAEVGADSSPLMAIPGTDTSPRPEPAAPPARGVAPSAEDSLAARRRSRMRASTTWRVYQPTKE
mmetsp:Transcript_11516/g.44652  ORF Transcript_11516/g.44652 Transcript_11516/m.44652 type:complete len:659 (+) Transcript_11516:1178-3154(+)